MTNPQNILPILHLIRTGLVIGLVTNDEIFEWAESIISRDEKPDIFFIDLVLSNSKSKNDLISYFSHYLNFDNPKVSGKPLLGLLRNKLNSYQINLEDAIRKLYQLKSEVIFTDTEQSFIYSIDDEYYCAKENIHGTVESVEQRLRNFLNSYKEFENNSFEDWFKVNISIQFENDGKLEEVDSHILDSLKPTSNKSRHWWKFWRTN